MQPLFRASAIIVALFAAAPIASAQTTTIIERPAVVELSPAQRMIVREHVLRERVVTLPPAVELRVGEPVPPSVELYSFPEEVYVEVPTLRRYRYLHVENEVVLVDPQTSEIIDIIRE
ncbi:MAG: DUF1236 domain-containing protein [Bradyrhizobiaceae bacterium]|nr:DUF1236 domain-containing protein [Bradyrhizobiaceae bacterium]